MWEKLIEIFNKPEWLLTEEEQFIIILIFNIILPMLTFTVFIVWTLLEIKFERWRLKWISKQLQKNRQHKNKH